MSWINSYNSSQPFMLKVRKNSNSRSLNDERHASLDRFAIFKVIYMVRCYLGISLSLSLSLSLPLSHQHFTCLFPKSLLLPEDNQSSHLNAPTGTRSNQSCTHSESLLSIFIQLCTKIVTLVTIPPSPPTPVCCLLCSGVVSSSTQSVWPAEKSHGLVQVSHWCAEGNWF